MKEEDMEQDIKKSKSSVPDREKVLKSIIERMHTTQRKFGMEMVTIKGQARAYLFAMELKELGFKVEDIK